MTTDIDTNDTKNPHSLALIKFRLEDFHESFQNF